ncbi:MULTISPECIES: Gfo/Idh/MocA family protein [unclassified Granulicatella]|uniref:Gfo/Idh/MocA family protein n=1 Tax=unclassified Granulicatella TaxID=2630493 RepID=UPI001073A9FA|nr:MULTISPECIES: Gfo/Idh/MocA family oxidoreductase [unclassified Granulicatella]MBF0780790.1 Gfo/Idh/MocA family oxidoreductase [Granulicatella sp. 19428wC4_WM01]TFU93835.1 Gfo/Idh/MocA family oxidoreductase [Granulicatella sp. WM01]
MNIGLIGCGQHMLNTMIPNIIGNRNCTIISACDIDKTRLIEIKSRLGNINLYESVEKMLDNEDIDIVVISVNPEMHMRFTKLALDKGVNVYVEKPIGHNFEGIKKLHELAMKNSLSVEYGAKWRYTEATKIAKEWLNKNKKKIKLITLDATFPIGIEKNPWGMSPMMGAIQEVFIHAIDYILSWIGYGIKNIHLNIANNTDCTKL